MQTLTCCPFHPLLLQSHVKDPGHSAKSAGGRLHLNMHTPFTQLSQSRLTMLSRHNVGTYLETSSHMSLGNTWPQSSQLAEPLWSDPCIKSGVSLHELISIQFCFLKVHAGNRRTFPRNDCSEEKATT